MYRFPRSAFYVAFAIAAAALPISALADGQSPSAPLGVGSKPPCRLVDASLEAPLDSRDTRIGTIFEFSTSPEDGGSVAHGFGIVDFVRGARRGGNAGQIGIEARYVQLADGTHLPATIAPRKDAPSVFNGHSRNAPALMGALGLVAGPGAGIVGVYNFVHQGSQVVIPTGTKLRIVLGDDYISGACELT